MTHPRAEGTRARSAAALASRTRWSAIAACVAGIALCYSETWRSVELAAFDRLVVRTAPGRVAMPITIVAIDEESMAEAGRQWPWPRSVHADLLDRLREAGAAVVAFDLVFGEPSADPAEDARFARAIADFGPVVLAANLEYRDSAGARQWIRVDPLPMFLQAGATPGLATIRTDPDGVQRGIPLSATAFWRAVLERFSQIHPGVVTRTDATERERIRYLGGTRTFPTVSYYRLLDPGSHLSANWKEALRDNIVLVGRTLQTPTELGSVVPDMFFTPHFPVTGALMPGVEIHANVIANMIVGETIHEAPRGWAVLLVVAAMLGVALATRHWHPLTAAAWTLGMVGAIAALEVWLLADLRIWLPGAAAIAAVTLAYAAQGTAGFLTERARRKELRRTFGLYVSPAVVDEIVANPEKLGLGGDRREITLLFTDLAGFTGISESLPAEHAARLLNRHLTEMTAVVMRHGGTVDKFIGDAVMAFWGAPIADPSQSKRALDAAIEMQRVMAATRAELLATGGPELRMRIGLHRGECIVGNLGGSGRFAYTAVGDCVNLASRIEGVNAVYGTGILLSESVARALPDRAGLRKVDTVRVKGKLHPVALFTPCDDPGLASQSAQALQAYEHGHWAEAVSHWEEIAARYPGDPIARVFVARLRDWARQGWPDPWDGVATLGSK